MIVREYFRELSAFCFRLAEGDEVILLQYQGEMSDFCRFNKGRIRQMGHVTDHRMRFRLIRGRRHSAFDLTLTTQADEDRERIREVLRTLRSIVSQVPEDPYLVFSAEGTSSEQVRDGQLPEVGQWTSDIRSNVKNLDVAGIYAAGPIFQGFASSLGQFNWFESRCFHFDWSVYVSLDKAVKASYAGFDWNAEALARKMEDCRRELSYLRLPERTVKPGGYRVYLAPQALAEVFGLLQWRGFGLKAQRTKSSPLMRLIEGTQRFSPEITVVEEAAAGASANFDAFGFLRPGSIPLIKGGSHAGSLVSARSSIEYGEKTTGASDHEAPESLVMKPGRLRMDSLLSELGDGLWINNLWYMNFSDAYAGRMTGMSRFASFLVKNGQISGPIKAMRFDEGLYRMFGESLVGLTEETEWMLSGSTYDKRSTESLNLPGALIDRLTFTL